MDFAKCKAGIIETRRDGEFRVLSIDGGGMKGIIPATYLKCIEEYIEEPIYKYFDLITGTSTGGIIALGLSMGISAKQMVDLYKDNGKKIFKKRSKGICSSMYDSKYLKDILQREFGDSKIQDALTMLLIPSIENYKAEPKVYKTPHHKDYIYDGSRYMWEVGLATSAAPFYFQAAQIGEKEYKLDGGLWANNPILVAVAEAKKLGFDLKQIKVLSLGTGEGIYNVDNDVALNGGLLKWNKQLVDLVFQVQSKSTTYTAKYLLEDNLCRQSPMLSKNLKLDSVHKKDIAHMETEAEHFFQKTFIKENVKSNFFS